MTSPHPASVPVPAALDRPASFAVVGGGWRTEFFLRLAAMAPHRLRATGVATRRAERAAELTRDWGAPAGTSVADLLRGERPDVVVVAVPWQAAPDAVRELVAEGVRVVVETPPAPDLAGLHALWSDVGASGLVQVAEQYLLMPGHAARREVVRRGVIGDATSVQVSSTHQYHAVSMVRGLLGVGGEEVLVSARAFEAPLADPLTPSGWDPGASPQLRTTTLATLDFGDGRHGLYDFTDNQWWNPLRARRLVVRGSLGEVDGDRVTRMVGPATPVTSTLSYRRRGVDLDLEGVDLDTVSFDGEVVYRNAWAGTRMSDDDLAVAQLLVDAALWARDEGPEPYPLRDGCQDHAIALAVEESARTRHEVRVDRQPWW